MIERVSAATVMHPHWSSREGFVDMAKQLLAHCRRFVLKKSQQEREREEERTRDRDRDRETEIETETAKVWHSLVRVYFIAHKGATLMDRCAHWSLLMDRCAHRMSTRRPLLHSVPVLVEALVMLANDDYPRIAAAGRNPPLATENLLENTDGGRSTPSVFSRGGSLLPSSYADARNIDAVDVSQAATAVLKDCADKAFESDLVVRSMTAPCILPAHLA